MWIIPEAGCAGGEAGAADLICRRFVDARQRGGQHGDGQGQQEGPQPAQHKAQPPGAHPGGVAAIRRITRAAQGYRGESMADPGYFEGRGAGFPSLSSVARMGRGIWYKLSCTLLTVTITGG